MTPALDAVRREELRKLAEAAMHMPGPWDAGEGASTHSLVLSFRDIDAGNDWPLRCAAYIAAMSPDTTLALLARIAELEAGLASTLRRFENCARHVGNDDETIAAATASARALLPKASVREEGK